MTEQGQEDPRFDSPLPADPRELRDAFTRFMMSYRFGLDELLTKINILRDEFAHLHSYNPIEHVSSRLKTPESLVQKAVRKNVPLTFDGVRENIFDIAGVRINCSFVADTYTVKDMLVGRDDVRVVDYEDYIANPKPNGYRSLHLTVEIPVSLSDRVQRVPVEVQIRTMAMDFWASLEHKIFYKYDGEVPTRLRTELRDAAIAAYRLDVTMERLHTEVTALDAERTPRTDAVDVGALEGVFLRSLLGDGGR